MLCPTNFGSFVPIAAVRNRSKSRPRQAFLRDGDQGNRYAALDSVGTARGGKLENNELRPSAIVGCAKSALARRE
jgi:hypothetical protein